MPYVAGLCMLVGCLASAFLVGYKVGQKDADAPAVVTVFQPVPVEVIPEGWEVRGIVPDLREGYSLDRFDARVYGPRGQSIRLPLCPGLMRHLLGQVVGTTRAARWEADLAAGPPPEPAPVPRGVPGDRVPTDTCPR